MMVESGAGDTQHNKFFFSTIISALTGWNCFHTTVAAAHDPVIGEPLKGPLDIRKQLSECIPRAAFVC